MIGNTLCLCPDPELLNPCKCENNDYISCAGNQVLNLKHVFETIDQKSNINKQFKRFTLSNTAITELEENTFYGITFDEIYIYNATNLKLINTHAFNGTESVTKIFNINCYVGFCEENLSTPLINSPPNYDIFQALSSMKNLEVLYLFNTNISEIPSNAFRPINGIQNKLYLICFDYSPIEKIGNNPFYDLNNLTYLSFKFSLIDSIPKNAFNLRNDSIFTLSLMLQFSNLNGSSFENGSLNNLKRPTDLELGGNTRLTYLDQTIYQPFFESNAKKSLFFGESKEIDCNDCRNYWLKKDPKYSNRTDLTICLNGRKYKDSRNFAKFTE